MQKQVQLYANEFTRHGKLKGNPIQNGEYHSLKISSISRGRITFLVMNHNIGGKIDVIRKQMQFENGKVYISFGKNDKLFIGEYTETAKTK